MCQPLKQHGGQIEQRQQQARTCGVIHKRYNAMQGEQDQKQLPSKRWRRDHAHNESIFCGDFCLQVDQRSGMRVAKMSAAWQNTAGKPVCSFSLGRTSAAGR